MKTVIMEIYDTKAEVWLTPPFFPRSRGEGIRSFSDLVKDPASDIGKHPEDYHLFESGARDAESGDWKIYEAKVSLGNGVDFGALSRAPRGE